MPEYFEQSLVLIKGSQLISQDDLENLSDIRTELQHNFKTGQIFRSQWEMINSVLNDVKFPTPDAKYWQSVREQQVHFQELTMLSYEYRMNVEKEKLLEVTLEEKLEELEHLGEGSFEYRKEEIKINMTSIKTEKLRYMMLNQQRTAKDRVREVLCWQMIMQELIPQMKHGIDSYEDHQSLSYRVRFRKEMEIAQGSSQSPSEARNLTALYERSQKAVE